MKQFGIWGPVNSNDNYIVSRSDELQDYIDRIKQGRYVVLFDPRQTGKTTFFQNAIDALESEKKQYFSILLNFEVYKNASTETFYKKFQREILSYVIPVIQAIPSQQLSEADIMNSFPI